LKRGSILLVFVVLPAVGVVGLVGSATIPISDGVLAQMMSVRVNCLLPLLPIERRSAQSSTTVLNLGRQVISISVRGCNVVILIKTDSDLRRLALVATFACVITP